MAFQEKLAEFGARARDHVLNLPILTRVIFILQLAVFVASRYTPSVVRYSILTLGQIKKWELWRLFTFSYLSPGVIPLIFDLVFFIGILGRFETDVGTLPATIMIIGVFPVLSALVFLGLDYLFLASSLLLMGASTNFFVLIGNESMKNHASNPTSEIFLISRFTVPTWAFPLALLGVFSLITPLEHLIALVCALLTGYCYALGYLNFLQVPRPIVQAIEDRLPILTRAPGFVRISTAQYSGGGKISDEVYLPVATNPGTALSRGTVAFPGQGNMLGSSNES